MNRLADMRFVAEYPIEKGDEVVPPWEEIGRKDAEEAINAAEEIISWVEDFIKWWRKRGKK
ncbi:MAG: HEPN domain-containing protein [Candidatus Baldrarchaeia archaeon]